VPDVFGKRALACLILISLPASSALSQGVGSKGNWQRIEADNGAVFQLDMSSIHRFGNGTAEATVYSVQGDAFNPENLRRLWFDCHGHYQDTTGPRISQTLYAAPRSMAGRISDIACVGAKDLTNGQESNSTPSSPAGKPSSNLNSLGRSGASVARSHGKKVS
jgi:hypothetical protein